MRPSAQGPITAAPLKVAAVTETYAPEINGVALVVQRLVEGLRHRGHRVVVVRPRRTNAPADPDTLAVPGMPLPFYRGLRFGLPARRLIERLSDPGRPDVIYVATEGLLGRSAVNQARLAGIPVVTGFHTNFHAYSSHYGVGFLARRVYAYLRRLHNRTDRTLVPTRELRSILVRDGFHNVEVVGRGVDSRLFSPQRRREALRAAWGLGSDGRAALYVGRLAPEKDLPLALEAFRAMRAARPGLRLVVVGDGPLYSRLCRDHPDVVFCGARRGEDLAEHYAAADFFLFPSQTETYGNVVLEAMASGLPVVAFDYAAPRDMITSGHDGLLAPMGDRQAFVEAAARLAATPGLAGRLGRAARQRAEQRDWSAVIEQFEGVLFRSLRGEAPPWATTP